MFWYFETIISRFPEEKLSFQQKKKYRKLDMIMLSKDHF